VIIALPMFGDYYTPNIISGSPKTSMLGNQIDIFFHGGPQPSVGASLTLILSLFLAVLMAYYMITIAKSQKELNA
jgi:spermidine/putrescine transport system permease protein